MRTLKTKKLTLLPASYSVFQHSVHRGLKGLPETKEFVLQTVFVKLAVPTAAGSSEIPHRGGALRAPGVKRSP